MIFKRTITEADGEVRLGAQSLKVLIALDGAKSLAEINQALGISNEDLKRIITELHHLNLIEKNEKSDS